MNRLFRFGCFTCVSTVFFVLGVVYVYKTPFSFWVFFSCFSVNFHFGCFICVQTAFFVFWCFIRFGSLIFVLVVVYVLHPPLLFFVLYMCINRLFCFGCFICV